MKKRAFPYSMFTAATLASVAMVFLISALYSQASTPCASHSLAYDSVQISTHSKSSAQFNNHQLLAKCNRDNEQISWYTWLFKRSDPVSFHYMDLLELLSRN